MQGTEARDVQVDVGAVMAMTTHPIWPHDQHIYTIFAEPPGARPDWEFQLGHRQAFSHRDPNKISLFEQKATRLRNQQVTMDWAFFALGSHKWGPSWARDDTWLWGPPPD